MKTYKIIFTFFATMILGVFILTGCSNDDGTINSYENFQNTSQLRLEIDLIQEFEAKLYSVTPELKQIVENPEFNNNPELYKEDLEFVLNPLVDISQRLMIAAGINESEVPELIDNPLSDSQIIGIGILIYSQETMSSSGNSVLDCVARAFVGFELHEGFWSSFTTRRALITAVGKVASRYLGAIGVALIVYDFVDCMWG